MKVAIVGSEGKYWTPQQRTKVIKRIKEIFQKYAPVDDSEVVKQYLYYHVILISGGCGATGETERQKFDGGIDVLAEIVADVLGVAKKIYYAKTFAWPHFRNRNIEIAEDTEVLYNIEPISIQGEPKSTWSEEYQCYYRRSGGVWTKEYAEKLGKETHLIVIK